MKSIFANWRTTLAGLLSLAAAGYSVYANPASILSPQVIGLVTAGAGLVAAKDGVKPAAPPAK